MTAIDSAARAVTEAVLRAPDGDWLLFRKPVRILQATAPGEVGPLLRAVEGFARADGAHAVGFLTYEAGSAFRLSVHRSDSDLPLAWFAVFDDPPVRVADLCDWTSGGVDGASSIGNLTPTVSADGFRHAFDRIKRWIADGETYQVNYTFRLDGAFRGDPRRLFADLVAAQRGPYAAFVRLGDRVLCSASPELFFRRTGTELLARPMKGTATRGLTTADDRRRRHALETSPKERAENVMIVDMMRNDVGRVADVGTVQVPDLFTIERYPTVWQMTSSVRAASSATLAEIFAALHPSPSVTGAPKVRTMELLTRLEPAPRGVYTGAIGFIQPNGDAQFNVAIRTAVIDERAETISFGVGSGIVWDSDPSGEYEECLLKGSVLKRDAASFELLETMRWTPGEGFFLLDRHLGRVEDSAEYFDAPFDGDRVRRALGAAVAGKTEALRVRLRIALDGRESVEATPLRVPRDVVRVRLAARPIARDNVFLYHKTTNRKVYEDARIEGFDDVVLWNEAGQVTESTIANLVIERGGARLTPPIECGLLAGTFRAHLLDRGEITETVLSIDDLRRAERIWLINSVQGWRPATLAG